MPSGIMTKVDYADYKELVRQCNDLEKENKALRAQLEAEQRKAEIEIKKDIRKGGKQNV